MTFTQFVDTEVTNNLQLFSEDEMVLRLALILR